MEGKIITLEPEKLEDYRGLLQRNNELQVRAAAGGVSGCGTAHAVPCQCKQRRRIDAARCDGFLLLFLKTDSDTREFRFPTWPKYRLRMKLVLRTVTG